MFKSVRARGALIATVSVAALFASGAAFAQETAVTPEEAATPAAPGGATRSSGIPEIVVTAQRRAQSLQDVPVAVSAFSDQALADQQIENTLDLQQALPNTTFTKGNFAGSNITIRGIGSAAVATSGDAGVGVHFNDMPLVAGGLFETEFFDLERIEVLRGPQGTLFGRNATGGVVNVISAKPDLSGFGAAGEIEYGNYDAITARGMVNVPIGETLGVRLAGIYLKRDGYTTNLNTGNDIDGRDYYSIRGTVMWEPTDSTSAYVTAQYREEDSNRSRIQKQLCLQDPTGILGCRPDGLAFDTINGNATLATVLTSQEFLAVNGLGGLPDAFALGGSLYGPNPFSNSVNPDDFRKVAIDYEPTYYADGLIIQGELEHDFGGITVSLNGGYADGSVDSRTDYNLATTNSLAPQIAAIQGFADLGITDPTNPLFGVQALANEVLATPLFQNGQICVSEAEDGDVGYIGGYINRCADNSTEFDRSNGKNEQWSIEGRVASDFDGPFNFLVGAIYLENETRDSDYYVNASLLDYASLVLGGFGPFLTGASPSIPGGLVSPFFRSNTPLYTLESLGIFGEVYYDFNDELTLTGGLRFSKDDKFVRDRQPFLTSFAPFGTDRLTPADFNGLDGLREQTASFEEFTGRVVLDWNPVTSFSDDTLVYASYSRGYKPGGINPPFDPAIFQAPATFAPEFINAFEIGTKNVFGGGSFVFNATAFYYDYSDFQVSRIVNRTSFNDNTDATVYGVEIESIINPVEALTINATLSYQKTEIKDLQLVDTRDPSGGRSNAVLIKDITNTSLCVVTSDTLDQDALGAIVSGFNGALGLQGAVPVPGTNALGAFSICSALRDAIVGGAFGAAGDLITLNEQADGTPILPDGVLYDLSGNELLNSPNFKASVGVQYEIDLGGWTLTPRADVNFTGNFFATNFNRPVDKVQSYEIVNAQLTLRSPDDRFYVRGFIQNAFDVTAETGRYVTDQSSGLFTNIFLTDPRRYGAAVGFRF